MFRIRAAAATLLVSLMVGSVSVAALGQDAPTGLEGPDWQLTQYTTDGTLVDVPADVSATLQLLDGQASGSLGCNRLNGVYQVDGQSVTFGDGFGSTKVFCEGDAGIVEEAYLSTVPTLTGWAIADDTLSLNDAEGITRLVFGRRAASDTPADLEQVVALLEAMQTQMAALDARLVALEGGTASAERPDGGAAPKLKKPKAPTPTGGRVQTTFPDWMRDEFRPQSERNDDRNRELVTWKKGKGGAIDGSRIYVRRGYCALKPGVNANQELDPDKDFTTRTGKAVLIDELPSSTKRYRPDHAQVDAALPAAPESPYSNDQYYDVLVSTFNAKGESAKTKVASFYLTPEFRCP